VIEDTPMVQMEKPENETYSNTRRAIGRRSQIRRSAPTRAMTHLSLGGVIVTLLLLVAVFVPAAKQVGFLVVALGYCSLFLICFTLLIGPLNLLRVRRNPVNLDLRRDIGIWAAITGCWHVLLVLRGIIPNGQALGYFLRTGCCGNSLLLNIFGISNDVGLFAVLILVLLLTLSNTLSLRMLKGKWWKRLQRLTYLLAVLAVAHTLGYQYLNLRGPILLASLLLLSLLVLICQGLGIALTLARQRRGS
jgi:methionine sulfoxide reductase heme-binding subunit